ncbi:MAG: hypothetical protein HY681_03010 [Chloroflexi bacterium]|nr:hypothetical protein [Chloroflexota bacterium]
MSNDSFSERHGFAPQTEPKADDYLPRRVREAVTNEIHNFVTTSSVFGLEPHGLYRVFRPYIWTVLEREPPKSPLGGPWAYYIPEVLLRCPWWQFYDILEEVCRFAGNRWEAQYLPRFMEQVNACLANEGIPWTLTDGKVVKRLNPQAATAIRAATTLLANPRFRGPDEQLGKAIQHFNKRPQPDKENCVKDAVGAVEATANIIAGTTGVQLNTLLDRKPFSVGIHHAIRQAIEKVYAYRGAAPGVSHGQVGAAAVELPEAEWVLTVSAATIAYLVGKFGR